jgi:hypothetical protein
MFTSIVVYMYSVIICAFLENHLMMAYLIHKNVCLCDGNTFIFI